MIIKKELKKLNHSEFTAVILPIDNKFADDLQKIEFIISDFSEDKQQLADILSKLLILFHLSLPFLAMLFLSASVKAYTIYFGVPIDLIDISSQINLLYTMLLDVIRIIYSLVFNIYFLIFVFFVLLTGKIILLIKRGLFLSFLKAPVFCIYLFDFTPKSIIIGLQFSYTLVIVLMVSILESSVSQVLYLSNDNNSSIYTEGTKLLKNKNNKFFNTLMEYEQLSTFPRFIKIESGKYIVVKAVKDDMVFYYTFDDLFENMSENNNDIMPSRICTLSENNKEKIDKYALRQFLTIGIDWPKSNIAPTTILIGSQNASDEFYKRAYEYEEKICQ